MDQLSKEILVESGVHFGHPTQKWNPGFKDYIAGQKNGIHIIDVQRTIENIEAATKIGSLIAERALKKGVKSVKFDRGGYKYHGRIKALAEAARIAGLKL